MHRTAMREHRWPRVVRAGPWDAQTVIPFRLPRPVRRRHQGMARIPSIGELLLGGVILALVGFVGSQVLASPRRIIRESRSLTPRDSAAIVSQYTRQVASRGEQYSPPEWLSQV